MIPLQDHIYATYFSNIFSKLLNFASSFSQINEGTQHSSIDLDQGQHIGGWQVVTSRSALASL